MTDRYAVFGQPVAHSKSPQIHMAFATQFSEDMTYEKIEAPKDGFAPALRAFLAEGGLGANITVPFKLDAFDIADDRQEAAQICGASNCLKLIDGRLVAENFDGIGLRRDVEVNLGMPLAGKRVLFAGAGGATRGAMVPFLKAGVAELAIANRSPGKAEAIRDLVSDHGSVTALRYDDIAHGYDIVLNATSTSLTGEMPPLPDVTFDGCALAYDLVYGKGKTPFLAKAEALGVGRIADGVGMLVEQAAEAFVWWRGKRPDTAPVIKDLTIPLE